MLECAILTSETEIESLADEWRQLHARVGRSPFTDYDYFRTWWDIIGKHEPRALHVVVGRSGGKLLGVLPLSVMRRKGLRVLQAGGHKAFYYCDMLCENSGEARQLWAAAKQSPHYDFADIRDVYPESLCHEALSALARKRDVTEAFCLRFNWPSSKDWIDSMPGKVNKIVRRRLRRLEEKAPVRFEICRTAPLSTAVIDGMVKQKIAWCDAHEKHGLFDHPNVLAYFREIVGLAAKQDQLFLSWLTCGDDTIAYMLCLLYQGVLHGYGITYDPAFSVYAPGILIMRNSLSWAIDNGYKAMDHRQGGGDYKSKYANETRHCAEFTFSGSVRGRLIESAFLLARNLWRMIKGGSDDAEGGGDTSAKSSKNAEERE